MINGKWKGLNGLRSCTPRKILKSCLLESSLNGQIANKNYSERVDYRTSDREAGGHTKMLTSPLMGTNLSFANENINKNYAYSSKNLWLDPIKVFGNNYTSTVLGNLNDAYDPRNSIPTVKHGSGRIMHVFHLRVQGIFTFSKAQHFIFVRKVIMRQ